MLTIAKTFFRVILNEDSINRIEMKSLSSTLLGNLREVKRSGNLNVAFHEDPSCVDENRRHPIRMTYLGVLSDFQV